jgi:hypothetical protein
MSTDEFFQQILLETKEVYNSSPIHQKQKEQGNNWNYSICGTPIQSRKGILMGFNWGVDD